MDAQEGTAFFPGSQLAGQGLLVSDGDTWRRQRQLANPPFRRSAVASYGAVRPSDRVSESVCTCAASASLPTPPSAAAPSPAPARCALPQALSLSSGSGVHKREAPPPPLCCVQAAWHRPGLGRRMRGARLRRFRRACLNCLGRGTHAAWLARDIGPCDLLRSVTRHLFTGATDKKDTKRHSW